MIRRRITNAQSQKMIVTDTAKHPRAATIA